MWPSILLADALKDVPRCLEIEAWNHGTAHPPTLSALRYINQLVAEMSGRALLPEVGVDRPALRVLLRECGYTQAQENKLTLREIIEELEGLAITRQLTPVPLAPAAQVSPAIPVMDAAAAAETGVADRQPGEQAADQPTIEQHMERMLMAIGDDTAIRIGAIASQKNRPGEERMKEILQLDSRFEGKDSVQWGALLGRTDAAVRRYDTWKRLQAMKKSQD